MQTIEFIFFFSIGIIPCILWLLFYLRQDVHPEPNKKVVEVFLWGILMVFPAVFLEKILGIFFPDEISLLSNLPLLFLYYIAGIGLIEEFFKYFVVKFTVINSSHFDEPIDAMLYLIIAGLGFATIENLLVVFNIGILEEAIIVSSTRLLTAIFLHTLAAAITGYFLAFSLHQKKKKRGTFIFSGLSLAATFHGLYNISMINLEKAENIFAFLLPIAIISLMAIIIYIFFLKVKKLPRTCKF